MIEAVVLNLLRAFCSILLNDLTPVKHSDVNTPHSSEDMMVDPPIPAP
jgi:hypothetical protein